MPKAKTFTEEIITELELISTQDENLAMALRALLWSTVDPPQLTLSDGGKVQRIVCRLETAADILRGILTCDPIPSWSDRTCPPHLPPT